MEEISCLVPELQSESITNAECNFFEKTQCLYVAMVNFNVPYTMVLRKINTCCKKSSFERQLGKTVVVKVGTYIVFLVRKTTVYGLKACRIVFFEEHVPAVHSNVFHISLTCL